MPRISLAEWRFVGVFGLGLLVFTSLPYVYAYASAPAGWRFMGIMVNVPDHVQYFSWLREFTTGWLSANLLTPEPNAPVFFNLLWLGLGRLSALTGLDYAAVFQGLRWVATAALLPVFYWFCAWYFDSVPKRVGAFLVAVLGGGLGWALVIIKYALDLPDVPAPLLVYIVEPNTFLGILSTPHLIGAALYMLCFVWLLQGEHTGQLRYAVGAGLFALFIGWQHTYDLILVWGIAGAYGALKWARDGRFPVFLFKSGLILGLLSCPPAFYSVALTSLDPVWRAVLAQFDNAGVFTPLPWELLILLGLPFGLALARALQLNPLRLKTWDDRALFISAWFWANFALIYIPTDYQIKMLNGWQLPIAVLATQFWLETLWPRLQAWQPRWHQWGATAALVTLLALVTPTNAYLWAWRFLDLSRHTYPFYLREADLAALRWLETSTQPRHVVFSGLTLGQYVPALTGQRAYLAHWAQTVDYFGKTANVQAFFAADTPEARRRALLAEFEVRYVLVGPTERALGPFDPDRVSWLKPVFTQDDVTVYQVQP